MNKNYCPEFFTKRQNNGSHVSVFRTLQALKQSTGEIVLKAIVIYIFIPCIILQVIQCQSINGSEDELTYSGKPLSYWKDLLASKEDHSQSDAFVAMSEISSYVRSAMLVSLQISKSSPNKEEMKRSLIHAIGETWCSTGSKSGVEILLDGLNSEDKSVRLVSLEAVGKLGPLAYKAVSLLERSLKDSDNDIRLESAKAIGMIGEPAIKATVSLANAYRDEKMDRGDLPGPGVREQIIWALGEIHGPPAEVLPILKLAFGDKRVSIRIVAIRTCLQYPEVGADLYDQMTTMAKDDPDENVQKAAATAANSLRARNVPPVPGQRPAPPSDPH